MKILLADDQAFVRDIVMWYLVEGGHTVETACDGQEALDSCEGEHFDLVITDLGMPRMDGLQLASMIKTRWPARLVLLLTGDGNIGALPPNVDFVLEKPVSFDTLNGLLKTLVV